MPSEEERTYVQCGFKEIKVESANIMEFRRQGWRNRDSLNQINGEWQYDYALDPTHGNNETKTNVFQDSDFLGHRK